ncbi:MAG: DUF2927 domain-containing protein [Cognatishimia sp.]|uniref:DUF2927 domain-containing protein n=1 Tax=Cognatishimia sp. TaxID=2211648 RepID=UPI003B8B4DF9
MATAGALSACTVASNDVPIKPTPVALPLPAAPSAQSAAIGTYYSNLQADLLVQGLLRKDGGGPDTPYTSDMLARNFERIAFYDEHAVGTRLQSANGEARQLVRWQDPVRIKVEFGPSVTGEQRTADKAFIDAFAGRLARLTSHPIRTNPLRPNFHVFVFGEDDRGTMQARINEVLPGLSSASRAIIQNLPRDMHCLILANSADDAVPQIKSAVAIVRAEHPDLLRQTCYHEEIAQGLGLLNDSRHARPSIFNDDDEFAFLTSHDEKLLQMLYDPRLKIGMTADEARPIVKQMARALTAQAL